MKPVTKTTFTSLYTNKKTGNKTSFRSNLSKDKLLKNPFLVFLHGFNGSSKSWAFQFEHFYQNGLIAIDAPGFGESDPVQGGMNAIADEVASLLYHLGVKRPIIIGHSMGGMLAQVIAANYPDVCGGLILSCTNKGKAYPEGTPLTADVEARILERRSLDDLVFGQLRVKKMLAGEPESNIFSFLSEIAGEIREAGLRCGGLAMQYLDTSPILDRIKAPVAIFTAENDIVVAPDAAAALAAGLPQARQVRLAGVGHAPYCEDAAAFNKAIEDFLMTVHDGPL